jgi:hypothetical protein
MRIARLALGVTLVSAACTSSADRSVDSATHASPRAPTVATTDQWKVTVRGIGPLEAGMTPAQTYRALGLSGEPPSAQAWKDCGYPELERVPAGVHVMVEEGTIARVDIRDSSTATVEGARVGDNEAHLRELYGQRLEVQPHKYTDGHFLVVRSADPRDSLFRIVFETDGKRVLEFRSGRQPAVQYVERCG